MSTVIELHPRTRQQQTAQQQAAQQQAAREQRRRVLRVVSPIPAAEPAAEPIGGHPLRLTRRGRFLVQVAVTVIVLLVVAAGVLLLNKPAEAGQQAQDVPVAYHVVLPGETMWQIAGQVAPGSDRRDTVDDLMELNALSSSAVSVGQKIAYPVTSSRP